MEEFKEQGNEEKEFPEVYGSNFESEEYTEECKRE
jgi:hypothetical protein